MLSIGRRGTPRKLNVPGEDTQKVAYRLLEPERIKGKKVMVVGGGDSAIESALLLKDENEVTLSYRSDQFSRLKPKNKEKINQAIEDKSIEALFNSNVSEIEEKSIKLKFNESDDCEGMGKRFGIYFCWWRITNPFFTKCRC